MQNLRLYTHTPPDTTQDISPPPPVDRQMHVKNITFQKLRLRAVNIIMWTDVGGGGELLGFRE